MSEIKEDAYLIRTLTLNDIARLASTMASHMIVMPVYRFSLNGKTIYFVQTTYKDYYKYYGIPIIYYCETEDAIANEKARYILIKTDEMGEKLEVSDRIKPGYIVIPIINLQEKPSFFGNHI
ncbi:MAG: hypothetical protein F7B61_03980 [Caldisphaeraceae archaeon]|nr:hypothetical protein [Caldisphaeraceae archaeon]